MEVTFHGVRGSIPTPGPETNRYGGNTSCVSVKTAAGRLLILDAGTGVIHLGRHLMAAEFGRGEGEAAILLSHAHWDHIQGFPFFGPVFVPGNRFTVYGPGRGSAMLEGILEGQMNPNYSPLHTMKNLGAAFELSAVEGAGPDPCDPREIAGLRVTAHKNPHGTTSALAWRLEEPATDGSADARSLVYASDAGYAACALPEAALAFYRDADVLIHDATYCPEDLVGREARGSSSILEAATCAVRAGVKHLVLTHYDQDYADDFVDGMVERTRRLLDELGGAHIGLTAAREGMTLLV